MQQFLTRHRWLILVAAALGQCVTFFPSGWAVFQPYLTEQLGYSPDAAALALPLTMVFFGILSIPGGRFQDTISPRLAGFVGTAFIAIAFLNFRWLPEGDPLWLYLGYSLCFGAGCGFLYQAIIATMLKWYADRSGFAAGLTSSLAGLFMVLQTYLTDALLTHMDVRSALLTCGVAALCIAIPVSSLLVVPPEGYLSQIAAHSEAGGEAPSRQVDFTPGEMLKTRQYYLLFASITLVIPAYMLLTPQLVSLCMAKGLTKAQALSAMAAGSAASAVGRLAVPTLSDRIGRKPTMAAMWALIAVMALLFMLSSGRAITVIWTCLVFFYSGGSALINPFTTDLFGLKNAGTNSGFMNISSAAGSLLGPALLPLAGGLLGDQAIHLIGIIGAALGLVCLLAVDPDTAKLKRSSH